jgi:hypothetical protein
MRVFGLWCLVFRHRTASGSKRVFEGNVFAKCKVCSRELFRDPKTGKWRGSRPEDHRPRKLVLTSDEGGPERRVRSSRR